MTGPKTNEREGTRALLRSAPLSAYKVREVLDLIRNQPVERANEILRFCERGAAEVVAKVLGSAVANAAANDDLPNEEELYVSACFADEAKTAKRMRPRARGRASRIRKRSAHITIIVSRMPEEQLRRVRARQEAEQAARRRRLRGGRARRGQAAEPAPSATEVAAIEEAAGIVDPQAEALAEVEREEAREAEAAEEALAAADGVVPAEAAAADVAADETADEATTGEPEAAVDKAAVDEAAVDEAPVDEAAVDEPEHKPGGPKEEG